MNITTSFTLVIATISLYSTNYMKFEQFLYFLSPHDSKTSQRTRFFLKKLLLTSDVTVLRLGRTAHQDVQELKALCYGSSSEWVRSLVYGQHRGFFL